MRLECGSVWVSYQGKYQNDPPGEHEYTAATCLVGSGVAVRNYPLEGLYVA
jgi:hypothetical protein